jgi:hypothetical protein
MKILSALLILITSVLSLKHGWDGLHLESNPDAARMAAELGFGKTSITIMSIVGMAAGIAILFPQTFYAATFINAGTIFLIMILSLRVGNFKTALIEIPFLAIPLLLIYWGHPLKK